MKEKKLGIIHIIITYIILPLGIVSCVLNEIAYIKNLVTNPNLISTAYIICLTLGVVFAFISFISFIQHNTKAYTMLMLYLLARFLDAVISDIIGVLLSISKGEVLYIPIAAVVVAIFGFLICRYYKNRIHLLDRPCVSSLFDYSETIISIALWILFVLPPVIIYVYSIYHMFQDSVGYGMFGICVPVISQLVFLGKTGFMTDYAVFLYFTVATYIAVYITYYFMDKTEQTI